MVSPCATDGPKGSVGSFWGKKRHLDTQISPSVPSLFQPSLSSSCDGYLHLTGTEKNVEIGGELREIDKILTRMGGESLGRVLPYKRYDTWQIPW
eukprot:scaffold697_cov104-Amphora_coffeaeformis.AAC.1